MDFDFGMSMDDIEAARLVVERVTGMKGTEWHHVDMGGVYYAFKGPGDMEMTLLRNFDVYDLEPFVDGCDDWPVVLVVDEAEENSPIVAALLNDKEHFSLQRQGPSFSEIVAREKQQEQG